MALKISYKDQIYRIKAPENFKALIDLISLKYFDISDRPLSLSFRKSRNNKLDIIDDQTYQDLLKDQESSNKKIIIETSEADQCSRISAFGGRDIIMERRIRSQSLSDKLALGTGSNQDQAEQKPIKGLRNTRSLSRNKDESSKEIQSEKIIAKVKKTKQSWIREKQKLHSDLVFTNKQMASITKMFDKITTYTIQNKHVYAVFLSLSDNFPKKYKQEFHDKLMEMFGSNSDSLLLESFNTITIFEENKEKLYDIAKIVGEWFTGLNGKVDQSIAAIMEFVPRLSRRKDLSLPEIFNVPIVTEYRFMGLWLDQKLLLKKQISLIEKKCREIIAKLKRKLNDSSIDSRVKAWKELIEPLFDSLLPAYMTEKASTNKSKLETLARVTFRKMVGLPNNFSNKKVEKMIGHTFKERTETLFRLYKQEIN